MSSSIALIIGAGKNIGASTAEMLHSKGYKVAQAARSLKPEDSTEDNLLVKTDLMRPESVIEAFDTVRKQWGDPSVILYNAAAAHPTSQEDPFAVSVEDFENDLTINTTSVYTAAKEAVSGFSRLPASAARTFLYTGNGLNEKPMPALLTLGVGKSATAHIIASAATAFAPQGYKFYYVDERKADGAFAYNAISGPGHAAFFKSLIENNEQGPWLATFVKDQGYKSFN